MSSATPWHACLGHLEFHAPHHLYRLLKPHHVNLFLCLLCIGKADSLSETPFETARREACEEIGLAGIGQRLPPPFVVEHLCELPANLAKTELVVRPCVALLHSYDTKTGQNADPETSLIPRLDAREVAAVFTAPFRNFLLSRDEHPVVAEKDPSVWYKGSWTNWHQSSWRSKYS